MFGKSCCTLLAILGSISAVSFTILLTINWKYLFRWYSFLLQVKGWTIFRRSIWSSSLLWQKFSSCTSQQKTMAPRLSDGSAAWTKSQSMSKVEWNSFEEGARWYFIIFFFYCIIASLRHDKWHLWKPFRWESGKWASLHCRIGAEYSSMTVWPYLAKFRHFSQI